MSFKFLLPILVLHLFGHSLVIGQSGCGFEDYPDDNVNLDPQDEGLPDRVRVGQLRLVNVNYTTTVAHGHNIYLSAQRFENGVYELLTTVDYKNFITDTRLDQIRRQANLYCLSGSSPVRVTFYLNVTDINNQPPVITGAEGVIDVPHENGIITVDTPILVTDADLWLENAQITLSTSNEFVTAEATLVNIGPFPPYPVTYNYTVKLMVNSDIPNGDHEFTLTASDGTNSESVSVKISIQAPVTEPQEPVCEFVGFNPEDPITVDEPIRWDIPVGTEIWRGRVTQIEEAISPPGHPHNKYLNALVDRDEFYLVTTSNFHDFPLEGTEFLTRSVVLDCVGGDEVTYEFSFAIGLPGVSS